MTAIKYMHVFPTSHPNGTPHYVALLSIGSKSYLKPYAWVESLSRADRLTLDYVPTKKTFTQQQLAETLERTAGAPTLNALFVHLNSEATRLQQRRIETRKKVRIGYHTRPEYAADAAMLARPDYSERLPHDWLHLYSDIDGTSTPAEGIPLPEQLTHLRRTRPQPAESGSTSVWRTFEPHPLERTLWRAMHNYEPVGNLEMHQGKHLTLSAYWEGALRSYPHRLKGSDRLAVTQFLEDLPSWFHKGFHHHPARDKKVNTRVPPPPEVRTLEALTAEEYAALPDPERLPLICALANHLSYCAVVGGATPDHQAELRTLLTGTLHYRYGPHTARIDSAPLYPSLTILKAERLSWNMLHRPGDYQYQPNWSEKQHRVYPRVAQQIQDGEHHVRRHYHWSRDAQGVLQYVHVASDYYRDGELVRVELDTPEPVETEHE